MISEDKMTHIVHLVLDGLVAQQMVEYPTPELAMREAKRVALEWLRELDSVSDLARKRIASQKNAPLEGSPQWDTLFSKYSEEELAKRGG